MRFLMIGIVGLALPGIACAPAANPSPSLAVTSNGPASQASPIVLLSIDPTKPDFELAENLTYDELKDISESS